MAISGEVAVPNGTCPARAVGVVTKVVVSNAMTRAVVASKTVKKSRFM
jgi:hypothetical protein